jgi:RNA polymerase sigma factor (sigma-70 family)
MTSTSHPTSVTDQELYKGITQRDNRAFRFLYEQYQERIAAMVQRNSGNAEDASDIFQEGVLALWTNIQRGRFELKDSARISTYLYALCRNIWISRLRRRKPDVELRDDLLEDDLPDETDAMLETHNRIQTIEARMQDLNEGCRNLLKMFYHQKTALREIAQRLGVTEKSAKNKKYRCMQQLRSLCTAAT